VVVVSPAEAGVSAAPGVAWPVPVVVSLVAGDWPVEPGVAWPVPVVVSLVAGDWPVEPVAALFGMEAERQLLRPVWLAPASVAMLFAATSVGRTSSVTASWAMPLSATVRSS
jgi:hypothetical protein